MASVQRIVLLDPGGDELFSGASVLSDAPPRAAAAAANVDVDVEIDAEEPCPETLRSSVWPQATAHDRIDVTIADSDGSEAA